MMLSVIEFNSSSSKLEFEKLEFYVNESCMAAVIFSEKTAGYTNVGP